MTKINFFLLILFSLLPHLALGKSCKTVLFNEQEIVCLNHGHGAVQVDERAFLIERRINKVANDMTLNPEGIIVSADQDRLNISLDDYVIMSLKEGDFVTTAPDSFEDDVELIAENLRILLIDSRESKGLRTMIRGGIYSAIATLLLIIVFYIYSKVFPKLYLFIEREGKKIPSVKIQNWEVLNSQRLVSFILWLAHVGRTLLTLLALYIYVPLLLSFFPQTAPMAPTIFNFVAEPLKDMLQTLVNFIPNFFIIVVIVVVTAYALKLIRFFFDEIEKGNIEFEGFYRDWATPSYMLVRLIVLAFSMIVIFPYIPGSESPAFKGVSVFFGILISLGSTSSIANIVAGVVITYMRPFRLGDLVKVNETMGVVTEKNLLVTRIRTDKNVDITVPNSMILGSHIVNYSNHSRDDEDGLIVPVQVDIGYDVPWQKVHKLLVEAGERTELVQAEPKPFIWHKTLNDNFVSYELNVYVKEVLKLARIKSDLNKNIQDLCFENGIELVSPIYTAVRDGNGTTIPKEFRSEK